MALHQLPKIVQRSKRLGRGIGGEGAKSGRGGKGQTARAGYSRKRGFEGGQTPLYMRLPKNRGSKQKSASQVLKPVAITIRHLAAFQEKTIVNPGMLLAAVQSPRLAYGIVKLIGNDKIDKQLTVRVHAISAGARASIEAAGGKVEIITKQVK